MFHVNLLFVSCHGRNKMDGRLRDGFANLQKYFFFMFGIPVQNQNKSFSVAKIKKDIFGDFQNRPSILFWP
jgi:hypothetical protein